MRRILSSSFIRLTRVCSRPGGVDQDRIAASAPCRTRSRRTRRPPDRRRRARGRCRRRRAPAQISSCSTAAARNVSAAQIERRVPCVLSRLRQLADGRRLAGAVDADDQRRPAGDARSTTGRVDGVERSRGFPALTRSRRLAPSRDRVLDGGDDRARSRRRRCRRRSAALRAPRRSRRRPARERRSGRVGARGRSRRSDRRSVAWCGRDPARIRSKKPIGAILPVDPLIRASRLRALRRSIKRFDRASRTSVRPLEHLGHLRGDRQLDAVARAERQRRAGRPHALGDHLHAGEDLRQRTAARELDADAAVAAQVARCRSAPDRRGRSGPASVSRRPPAAHASRVISARPRVISAASALWPSPALRPRRRRSR